MCVGGWVGVWACVLDVLDECVCVCMQCVYHVGVRVCVCARV